KPGAAGWQQSFLLEPLKPGDLALALGELHFRDGPEAPWQLVAWKPVPVRVTTVITRPDTAELRDITPIDQLPPRPSWWDPLWAPGLVIGALSVTAIAWLWLRSRRKPAPAPTPEQWALQELGAIPEPDPLVPGAVERFHTLLSDVVRHFLELRFQ